MCSKSCYFDLATISQKVIPKTSINPERVRVWEAFTWVLPVVANSPNNNDQTTNNTYLKLSRLEIKKISMIAFEERWNMISIILKS